MKEFGGQRSVMAKLMDCILEASEFERYSRYEIYNRTNVLREENESLLPIP